MTILLLTDPINTVYGAKAQPWFEELRAAGVEVVLTDLRKLRDSNLAYSPWWRVFLQWWGTPEGETLSNPLGPGKIGLPAMLELLNFKANHRKTLVVDDAEAPGGVAALVTSANPHSASVGHGNVALRFGGLAALDLLRTEEAVYRESTGDEFPAPLRRAMAALEGEEGAGPSADNGEAVRLQVLTERSIHRELLEQTDSLREGEALDVALFYFSDRPLCRALVEAAVRGVAVRVLLDPNKDAFGRSKNGIPNRQVAAELQAAGVDVRWYRTRGEQFHSKMALFHRATGETTLIIGSANWTRRNLLNYNLETNLLVTGPADAPALRDSADYFNAVWAFPGERRTMDWPALETTVPYAEYEDPSLARKWLYRFMERSGASTF